MKPKTKILIAYDGVNPVKYVVQDLKRAGLPIGAEVSVLTVANGFMPPAAFKRNQPLAAKGMWKAALAGMKSELRRAKNKARRAAKKMQTSFPGWQVRGIGCVDSPARAIVKMAKEWKAHLVVVGSHNYSVTEKFFLGSVSQKVIRGVPCSVRVVRRVLNEASAARIVIGVDGSHDCELAVQAVANRVWKKGSAVRLITAMDNPMTSAVFVPAWGVDRWIREEDKKENEWIHRMALSYQGRLEAAKLSVSIIVKIGDPKSILLEEAARWGADCIFVGARGLNKFEHFFMGSVSSAVASRARCSVEVVRQGL